MLSLLAITLFPARFSEIAWVTAAVSVLLGKSHHCFKLSIIRGYHLTRNTASRPVMSARMSLRNSTAPRLERREC